MRGAVTRRLACLEGLPTAQREGTLHAMKRVCALTVATLLTACGGSVGDDPTDVSEAESTQGETSSSTSPSETGSTSTGEEAGDGDGDAETESGDGDGDAESETGDGDGDGFAHVSTYGRAACAVRQNSKVECWGDHWSEDGVSALPPVSEGYLEVHPGSRHSCGLTSAGAVECWGDNSFGQLDLPSLGPVRTLEVGGFSACALLESGDIRCWGSFGDANVADPEGSDWTALDVADTDHACATDSSGVLTCWGYEPGFEFQPPTEAVSDFVLGAAECVLYLAGGGECLGSTGPGWVYEMPDESFDAIAGNGQLVCGTLSTGEPLCWGFAPAVGSEPKVALSGLKAAGGSACGIDAEGQLHCWGESEIIDGVPS